MGISRPGRSRTKRFYPHENNEFPALALNDTLDAFSKDEYVTMPFSSALQDFRVVQDRSVYLQENWPLELKVILDEVLLDFPRVKQAIDSKEIKLGIIKHSSRYFLKHLFLWGKC